MEAVLNAVGIKEIKDQFSSLTARLNELGVPLTVTKNNKPWVTIYPADAASAERVRKRRLFQALTRGIEGEALDEPEWDEAKSDKDLLGEERMRRFG